MEEHVQTAWYSQTPYLNRYFSDIYDETGFLIALLQSSGDPIIFVCSVAGNTLHVGRTESNGM